MSTFKPKRPKSFDIGSTHCRVVRGPNEQGQWYWRAEKERQTIWTGWGTAFEVERVLAEMVVTGESPRRADTTTIVKDLLECWWASIKDREDLSSYSIIRYKAAGRRLVSELGENPIHQMTQRTLEVWRDKQLKDHSPVSVLGELIILRIAWKWALEVGLVVKPLPKIKIRAKVQPKPTPLPEEIAALLGLLSGWERRVVWLFAVTGARLGEIADLTWGQIDLQRGWLQVSGKTGARKIPLSAAIRAEIAKWEPKGPKDRVWPVCYNTVRIALCKRLKKVCEELGYPRFSIQSFRRAAVGTLYRKGIDIAAAAAILGHSPATALRHYRLVNDQDLQDAADLLTLPSSPICAHPLRTTSEKSRLKGNG